MTVEVTLLLRSAVLLSICLLAAVCDIKSGKIPNTVTFSGIVLGLLFHFSFDEWIRIFAGLVFIFFFGMLGLMGMGDIKLWMAIMSLSGFSDSCFIIAGAAALFIIYQLVKDHKKTVQICRLTVESLFTNRKIIRFEQKGYPFAPYVLVSCLMYCLIQLGGLL